MKVLLQPRRPTGSFVIDPPISKSDAHRALVLGELLGIPVEMGTREREASLPNDVLVLKRGLEKLREAESREVEIDVEDAGAPFRILLALAATRPHARVRFVGTPRLQERPHGPLVQSLQAALGEDAVPSAVRWPLSVRGTLPRAGNFSIDAAQSSQFVTGLLLAAVQLRTRSGLAVTVDLLGETASEGYLALTLRWLEQVGFKVSTQSGRMTCEPVSAPPDRLLVPGDWSSLGYLLLLAWKQGGALRSVPEAQHPDAHILEVLRSVGLSVVRTSSGCEIRGQPLVGFDVDVSRCPDLAPTLAALSLVLPAPSLLRRVGILRGKESDRILGIQALCRSFGGRAELSGDELRLFGSSGQAVEHPIHLNPSGDHRQAMAAAVASALTSLPATIEHAECVAKSFPQFWESVASTGIEVKQVTP